MTASASKARRESLNLRIQPGLRHLIDQAAELAGKNRTDFMLDAARQAAESAIRERTLVALNSKAYAAFVERLDAPPQPNARLLRSLTAPGPWEESRS